MDDFETWAGRELFFIEHPEVYDRFHGLHNTAERIHNLAHESRGSVEPMRGAFTRAMGAGPDLMNISIYLPYVAGWTVAAVANSLADRLHRRANKLLPETFRGMEYESDF